MSEPTILDEGPPDDWDGTVRECDICHKVGNCSFTDDPVFQNADDEWWCFPCWAKRVMQGEGKPKGGA